MMTSTSRSRSIPFVNHPIASGTVHCLSLRVGEQVHEASIFVVVLTTQYLGSHKCMLGLLTAWRLRKPIVVLREADVRYGGLSAGSFAEEVALYLARYGNGV